MRDFFIYFNEHFVLFILTISLLIFLFIASRINKKYKKLLISIVFAILILTVFEYLETLFNDKRVDEENFPRYLFSFLCYALRPVIIVLFYHIRLDFKDKKHYLIWIGVVINTVIYFIAMLSYFVPSLRFVIWYNANNTFNRSWLGYTVYVICGLYLLSLVITSIVDTTIHKTRRQIDFIILLTTMIAIVAQVLAISLRIDYANSSEAFIIGAALYFMYLNFDKSSTEAIVHERSMQEKTTALMLSQIQPHFIYNTLTTIQVLCEIDPEKAAKTIGDFSQYLRLHTDALSKSGPVPVLEEIKHAMAYADIEMVRFDNVKVIFAIKDKDFKLPVLTIEPMVENAIKYGVRAREKGLVEVITYKEDDKHVLVIRDNGIGFNPDVIKYDAKNHVGIENVKTRVENMVHGTFKIESEIDKGTTVTITVPEEN